GPGHRRTGSVLRRTAPVDGATRQPRDRPALRASAPVFVSEVVVVATRSPDKLREIHQLLPAIPGIRLADLDDAGIPWAPEEEAIEAFDTFEENALAKARYFHDRSGLAVLADDSGLC